MGHRDSSPGNLSRQELRERCEREDLLMFINSGFAATRQNEFYTDLYRPSVSIEFLHRYVLINYRLLYARTLAAGINHFNQQQIIFNLLQAGAPADKVQRAEEGTLIAITLRRLPANRVYALFARLQQHRVNNRRTRAVIKTYLAWRREPEFDAIKYRNKYRAAAAHAHTRLEEELGRFLFDHTNQKAYQTPLLNQFRQAQYSEAAIYELPFTVAESLAQKHQVPRDVFLKKIEHKMTTAEKLRFQSTAARTKGAKLEFDLTRAGVTKLALYVLSLSRKEREQRVDELEAAFTGAAERQLRRVPLKLGRVATVLDSSHSTVGSRERRNRPLGVALAASYLLREAAEEYRAFWTPANEQEEHEFLTRPAGQTALAEPLLDALEWQPDLIVIVSDGYENDPPQLVDQVARVYRERIGKTETPEIVHMNPVFDADHFAPRRLGTTIPTVGLRDAEDIPTMLGFARFTVGTASLKELEEYLALRVNRMLKSDET
ncbi:hypothetical protein [uncultured Gimesia sp.]|jgi:hypothetical protein|uniref:hypothetical protein n=1 Tax=uncultured Gimesia sp. TaxID=1678688 RepID=UPI002604F424|nr:hypothetical protein [uncultured Gimesia sp.]